MNAIQELRRELHQNPELSGLEINTARRIERFITTYHPTQILRNLGGHGLAALYEYSEDGPTIAIRCELDALPIEESNRFVYKSMVKAVAHKCGHDGHMAMVAGLIFWLKEQVFEKGRVILLFQPAEETGQGAYAVLNDQRFSQLQIDYMFALHNIPGAEMHSIIVMEEGFSAEVQSFSIKLSGKESHAAEPENGINPAKGISEIIAALSRLNLHDPREKDFAILTPVHINLGEKSYGISPGAGEVHYTVRTWTSEKMVMLKTAIEDSVEQLCRLEKLEYQMEWFEHFPAAENNRACNQLIKEAARSIGGSIIERPYPFKFGEDFGWFSKQYKTGMFGLGAGINTPALHHANYDFPDEIISTGIDMFKTIISFIFQKVE